MVLCGFIHNMMQHLSYNVKGLPSTAGYKTILAHGIFLLEGKERRKCFI